METNRSKQILKESSKRFFTRQNKVGARNMSFELEVIARYESKTAQTKQQALELAVQSFRRELNKWYDDDNCLPLSAMFDVRVREK